MRLDFAYENWNCLIFFCFVKISVLDFSLSFLACYLAYLIFYYACEKGFFLLDEYILLCGCRRGRKKSSNLWDIHESYCVAIRFWENQISSCNMTWIEDVWLSYVFMNKSSWGQWDSHFLSFVIKYYITDLKQMHSHVKFSSGCFTSFLFKIVDNHFLMKSLWVNFV